MIPFNVNPKIKKWTYYIIIDYLLKYFHNSSSSVLIEKSKGNRPICSRVNINPSICTIYLKWLMIICDRNNPLNVVLRIAMYIHVVLVCSAWNMVILMLRNIPHFTKLELWLSIAWLADYFTWIYYSCLINWLTWIDCSS